jgi:hypothetical protein
MVGEALSHPCPSVPTGITAGFLEVFGSLRRWLAYREPCSVTLSYIGPADHAGGSPVPRLLDFPLPGAAQWSTSAVLGDDGLAAVDRAGQADGEGLDALLPLAVRSFGRADAEARRLPELLRSWDVAGRPGADRLRIDAFPLSMAAPSGLVPTHESAHTTFVVSW